MLRSLARGLAARSNPARAGLGRVLGGTRTAGCGCGCAAGACRCGCRACAAGPFFSTSSPFSTSAAATPSPSPEEAAVAAKLASAFPGCTATVTDTSGGCGTMFQVQVTSPSFTGVPTPRQHLLVARALSEFIPTWHGWVCETRAGGATR